MPRKKRPPAGPPAPPEPPPDPAALPLSELERRFVDEYMIDLCAARAYLAVQPGIDYRTAVTSGRRMRLRPHVAAEIRARKYDNRIRCKVRADNVLQELAYIAFLDIADLFGPENRLQPMRAIPLASRRAVKAVKLRRERTTRNTTTRREGRSTVTVDTTVHECEVEVVLHDKVAALDKLCRYLGLDESIPPLDRLLDALPADLADAVRTRLAIADAPPALPAAGGQTQTPVVP